MTTVTNKLKIAALYTAVFNRAPDQTGLGFWAKEAETSTTVFNTIANGFVQHPVFTEVYASLDNSAFVNALYVNILGAAGDAPGVAYWTGLLNNNSRADVLSSFVQASLEIDLSVGAAALNITEAELATAQTRQNFITNKATVGVAFADLLGPDSNLKATTNPNTLAGLRADPAYLVSEAVLKSVTDNKASADAKITVIQNAADSYNDPGSDDALLFIANVFATEAAEAASRTIVMTSVANPTGAAGKIYSLDGVNRPELQFVRGAVYVFDQSDASNVTHQIAFKDANGFSYTTGVVTSGIAGQAGAKTTLTVASDAPEGLRYYCVTHGNNMGNTIANTGGAASYFVVEAMSDQAYGANFSGGAASYYNTSASDNDNTFMLFDHSFDEALEFAGVTLVGTVELNG